jgi:Tol biopolymer transport system component
VITVRTAAVVFSLALAGCGGAGSPAAGPIVFAGRPENPDVNGYGWQLMVVNPDGTGFRRLTRTDGDIAPRWSPDGTKVVFERLTSDSAPCDQCVQIWVVNADGGSEQRLTSVDEDADSPAWSPEGKHIAFSKRDHDRETDDINHYEADIYLMNSDGSQEKRLTDLAGVETEPTWSPDGEHIAFSTERREQGDIYVMDADGAKLTRLTDRPGVEIEPTWSPDGKQIAFSTQWVQRGDIYVMNSDGSELRRLTDPKVGESSPAWSPDGDRFAFMRFGDEVAKIVVANEDGSEEREVPSPGEYQFHVTRPVWSPDGKRLAFTVEEEEGIWVVDSDGGNTRKLWSGPATEPLGLDWAAAHD